VKQILTDPVEVHFAELFSSLSFLLIYRITHFYARKQNASRVFAIVWASVCMSVCLSICHTRDLYQNGAS